MFVVEGRQTRAQIREDHEMEAIITAMKSAGYQPALRAMVAGLCTAASINTSAVPTASIAVRRFLLRATPRALPALGDLFFRRDHMFAIQPIGTDLYCWEIRHQSTESEIDTFCSDIEAVTKERLDGRRVRGMKFSWGPSRDLSPGLGTVPRTRTRRDMPQLKFQEPEYGLSEKTAALLLTRSDYRSFMLHLAQATKARVVDLIDTPATKDIAEELVRADLVRPEFLVICRQDSRTICTVPTRDLLQMQGEEITCPICGRKLKEEVIHDIYAPTELARKLLQGSRWMLIWVTELIIQNGVRPDQVKWYPGMSGEDLDILLQAFGFRTFFELKDREFGSGDAYPFTIRIARYGGSYGVVISTERISEDAKSYFQEHQNDTAAPRIKLLEGETQIETDIADLLDEMSRVQVYSIVSFLSESMGINLQPVVREWLNSVAKPR